MDKIHRDKLDQLNGISPSFCAAKWLNATLWLGNGRTASCHHPIAHNVLPMELMNNASALHNTSYKKQQRKDMLDGKRPPECNYCWQIEDIDDTVCSDRVHKSIIYTDEELASISTLGWDADVDPINLEISFDNLCNLSCMYCNPEFSSTWGNDIKKNGPYRMLETDGGGAFKNDGSHALAFGAKNKNNFYITSFFKWFDGGLKDNLRELRVTGGEPTRSPYFWELVDRCEGTTFNFAVNSNLIMDTDKLDRLIDCATKFERFDLYTSCEAYGSNANLIRHGFDYDDWKSNLSKFMNTAEYDHVVVMMTINAMGIFSIIDFLNDMLAFRQLHGGSDRLSLSLNVLRFPSFQSVNILSRDIKTILADELDEWVVLNQSLLTLNEIDQCSRVMTYLREIGTDGSYDNNHVVDDNITDFVNFVNEFCDRRDIVVTDYIYSELFLKWWDSINDQIT